MEIKIAKGVNYDYILVLSLNDEKRLELKKVPIKRSLSLINKLLSYCEESFYDIEDMYNALKRGIDTSEPFDDCLSHDYSDSFISEVCFPEINVTDYRKEVGTYKESLFQKTYKRLKYAHKDWSNDTLRTEANQLIEQDLNKFIQKKKSSYISRCLNFIYSYDYSVAIKGIESSNKMISFSNERHGRFSYEHEVNEDLKVRISTNFCYGKASSFRVIITYKGIKILPYSIWIKYYYAGFTELLHCTRSYSVCRANWDVCMKFVSDFVNSAIDNPKSFVHNVVMKEVSDMMNGLRNIYTLGKDYLNRIMEVEPSEECEYVGVRNIHHSTPIERKYYSVYPNEMYLVYRIGKISGALRFLDNLKQLAEICTDINPYIEELSIMNVSIYPELIEAIPPIKNDVLNLEQKLKIEEKRLKWLNNRFEFLENKLDRILSKCNFEDQKCRRLLFLKNNPKYEKLKEQVDMQLNTVYQIKGDLSRRNSFLSDLQSFKKLIEKYVELPQVA